MALLGQDLNPSASVQEGFRRFGRWYTQLAVLLLNTAILLLGITLITYAYYGRERRTAPRTVYSTSLRSQAIHRMDPGQATAFFQEFDRMGAAETYIYQPWIGLSERVFHSAKLNVDEALPAPTRRTWRNSGGGKPPLIIWAFGGSTMFGWGVPDDETVASHLAKVLGRMLPERSVTVINYGHSYFFSSQELALFQILLRRGERCDLAVFLDGLNDANTYSLSDVPPFSDRLQSAFEKEQQRNPTTERYFWISPEFPPMKLFAGIQSRLARRAVAPIVPPPTYDAALKYQVNMAAEASLGSTAGVKTAFFWQPVPSAPAYAGARDLAAKVHQSVQSRGFHFIGDLFQGIDEHDVYVDNHHYGDTGCERVAEAMARGILAEVAKNH